MSNTKLMTVAALMLAAIPSLTASGQGPDIHDWENPSVLSINKLPYHATLQLPSRQSECKEIISLDGQWSFHWKPPGEPGRKGASALP